MPIYEYKCDLCGQIFEKLIFSSEEGEETICTKCGDNKPRRIISATGILGTSCAQSDSGFS